MKIPVSGHHLQFCDIHKYFQSLPPAQLSLLSLVSLLVKLITLVPATNVVSERSASPLRCVKTYKVFNDISAFKQHDSSSCT